MSSGIKLNFLDPTPSSSLCPWHLFSTLCLMHLRNLVQHHSYLKCGTKQVFQFKVFPSGCTRVVAAKAEVSCHQGSLSPRLPHLAIALDGLLFLHSASRFCKKLAIHSLAFASHQVHKRLDLENPADFGIPKRLVPDCHLRVCAEVLTIMRFSWTTTHYHLVSFKPSVMRFHR